MIFAHSKQNEKWKKSSIFVVVACDAHSLYHVASDFRRIFFSSRLLIIMKWASWKLNQFHGVEMLMKIRKILKSFRMSVPLTLEYSVYVIELLAANFIYGLTTYCTWGHSKLIEFFNELSKHLMKIVFCLKNWFVFGLWKICWRN